MMFASDNYKDEKMMGDYFFIDIVEDNKIMVSNNVSQVSSIASIDENDKYTIKPVFFITGNAKIRSGNGTYSHPYLIK